LANLKKTKNFISWLVYKLVLMSTICFQSHVLPVIATILFAKKNIDYIRDAVQCISAVLQVIMFYFYFKSFIWAFKRNNLSDNGQAKTNSKDLLELKKINLITCKQVRKIHESNNEI